MSSSQARREKAAQEKAQRRLEREPISMDFMYPPVALLHQGPILITDLGVSGTHREALEKAGQSIPAPVRCRFLIDTGADGTVVKHEFAEKAGLKLINDNHPLRGIGMDTTGRSYIGRIIFGYESRVVPGAKHTMFVETQIMSANLEHELIDGLIGRDVLAHFLFTYDGKTGQIRMRYHRPTASAT
jgi:predicted aspartyl protease